MAPDRTTPFCATVLPVPATMALLGLPVTLELRTSVPPLSADNVPLFWIVSSAPLFVWSVIVPPATSAEIVPLLISVEPPPTSAWLPTVPFWPWMSMPDPMTSVPPFSTERRLLDPVSPSVMTPVPLSVWVPPPSKARMLFALMLTLPFSARLPRMTSTPVFEARLSAPVNVTLLKTFAWLLVATKFPVPAALMMPETITPFCRTVLPAPTLIELPLFPVTLLLRTSVPPFAADKRPLLVTALVAPLLVWSVIVPPETSAEMVPLLISVAGPPASAWPPMVPFWPWTSTPEPTVSVPPFSMVMRFEPPVSPRLMTPDPPSVWEAPPSNASTLFPLTLTVLPAARVNPLTTRSKPVLVARSRVPLRVTPDSTLAPLFVATNAPPPLVLIVPPAIATAFWTTLLPEPAAVMWPLPVLTTAPLNCSVPPSVADSVLLLLVVFATRLIRPPATSAERVPPLLSVLAPPMNTWPPIVPFCPWMRVFAPVTRVPPPSMVTRLDPPVSPSVIVPFPPSVCVPASKPRMLLPLTSTLPFNVKPPPVMRSMPVLVARSSVPWSVTPLRKLPPLLEAASAPVPVVLMVPPAIVVPNWLMTLPFPTLMTPPALAMLFETCSAAVAAPPTLIVPLFVVLPPPSRLSVKASMLIVPAFESVVICSA